MALASGAVGLAGPRGRRAAEAAGWLTLAMVAARVAQVLADPVFAG